MRNARPKLRQEIIATLRRLRILMQELGFSESEEPTVSLNCDEALNKLAAAMKTTPERIRLRSNSPSIVGPRQICQYVLRQCLEVGNTEIAHATGLEDHTTVMYSCKKVEAMRLSNPEFDEKIRHLCGVLLNRNSREEVA